MTDLAALRARGERFRVFYEQDGLKDAVNNLRAVYAERVTQLDPHDRDFGDKAKTLAIARRVVDQVEAAIITFMGEGKVAKAELEHMKKLDEMNPKKRRFLCSARTLATSA